MSAWTDQSRRARSDALADAALQAAGRPRTGPFESVKAWGRSFVQRAPTAQSKLWLKEGYSLPPGEERVLATLRPRHRAQLPHVIAIWDGGFAAEPIPGRELAVDDPVETWAQVAQSLGTLMAAERDHVDAWLALGLRDRRPAQWRGAVEALLGSPVLSALSDETAQLLEGFRDDFIERFPAAFASAATLVPQDSGCCNIHVTDAGPIFFDWADVVVGHPVFSCDRLLDQTPATHREAVIAAFLAPLEMSRVEFDAMRRSNVLHEVLRYHDELAISTQVTTFMFRCRIRFVRS